MSPHLPGHLAGHLAPSQYRRASDTTNEADPGRQELINECPGKSVAIGGVSQIGLIRLDFFLKWDCFSLEIYIDLAFKDRFLMEDLEIRA